MFDLDALAELDQSLAALTGAAPARPKAPPAPRPAPAPVPAAQAPAGCPHLARLRAAEGA